MRTGTEPDTLTQPDLRRCRITRGHSACRRRCRRCHVARIDPCLLDDTCRSACLNGALSHAISAPYSTPFPTAVSDHNALTCTYRRGLPSMQQTLLRCRTITHNALTCDDVTYIEVTALHYASLICITLHMWLANLSEYPICALTCIVTAREQCS